MQSCQPLRNRILCRLDCLHRRPRIILLSDRIKRERQQQFCSKFNGGLAAHQLQHQIHRNRIPLPRAIVPLHLHDLALVRKILANEMHFLMCNAHEIGAREASVLQFVPNFPTRSLRGCQVIHHPHRNTIDSRRKRDATITAQPVSEVLQRLKDVVTNLFRIIVGNETRRVSIRHKQRTRIQRIVQIKTAHV